MGDTPENYEPTEYEKTILERVKAFSAIVSAESIGDILTMDGVQPVSHALFCHGEAIQYIMVYGVEDAMRLAFCLGAAWEREFREGTSSKTLRLLDGVNLDYSGEDNG